MRIQIVNRSTDPEVALALPKIVEAARIMFPRPAADHDLPVPEIAYSPLVMAPPAGSYGVFVRDRPGATEGGVEGYHDAESGAPTAYVFDGFIPSGAKLHDASGRGESLAALVMHEVLEMWADAFAELYAQAPFRAPHTEQLFGWVAYELCDPVQESALPVTISSGEVVDFANWVTPSWFRADGVGPFDGGGVLVAPLSLAPGGYAIVDGAAGESEVMGARLVYHHEPMAMWRAQMKRVNAWSRTRRRQSWDDHG